MARSTRRRTAWARRVTLTGLAVPTAGIDLLSEWDSLVSNTVQAGVTIARIHLMVSVTTGGSSGGLAVVSVGIRDRSAVPNIAGPVTAPHDDWMVWQPVPVTSVTSANSYLSVIDNQSMRKMRAGGEFLNLAVEGIGAGAAVLTVVSSVLVMLP